jgi:hypothetical protein
MRWGQKHGIINLVKSASKCAAFTRAQSPQYGEGFFKARTPLVKGNSKRIEFRLVPTSPNSENESPLTDFVDSSRHLGKKRRWVKAHAGNQWAKFNSLGNCGEG